MISVPAGVGGSWPPGVVLAGWFGVGGGLRRRGGVVLSESPGFGVLWGDGVRYHAEAGVHVFVYGTVTGTTDGQVFDRSRDAVGVARLFLDEGVMGLGRLTGLACVVVWDERNDTAFLIRHPGGAPRLVYRIDGESVEWATRLEPLIRPDDRPDYIAYTEGLRIGSTLPPRTMIDGISAVLPGHALEITRGTTRSISLWNPTWNEVNNHPLEQRLDTLDRLINTAIEGWMSTTTKTPAILLSGGIDSVGLAASLHRLGINVTAYTVTFEDDTSLIVEYVQADLVAQHLQIPHHPILYKPQFIEDHLDWMATWYEAPIGYGLHTAQLAPLAANNHDLVFGGTGPEWFYPSDNERRWRPLVDHLRPQTAGSLAASMRGLRRIRGGRGLQAALARRGRDDITRAISEGGPSSSEELLATLVPPGLLEGTATAIATSLAEAQARVTTQDHLARIAFGWVHHGYDDRSAFWMDRWAEAYGMRSALPLIDARISDFVASLKRGIDRREFRDLATRSLPRDLAYNRKVGQSLPLDRWFRNQLADLIHDRLANNDLDGYLDTNTVNTIITEHTSGQHDHKWLIWKLLNLTAWHQNFEHMRHDTPVPSGQGPR